MPNGLRTGGTDEEKLKGAHSALPHVFISKMDKRRCSQCRRRQQRVGRKANIEVALLGERQNTASPA